MSDAAFAGLFVLAVLGIAIGWGWKVFRGETVGWVVGSRDHPRRVTGTVRVLVKRHPTGDMARPEVIVQMRITLALAQRSFDPEDAWEFARALERARWHAAEKRLD